jgi:hypothetical protein
VIRRGTFTAAPPAGDYVLSTTGATWNVDRTKGDSAVLRFVTGERTRTSALAALLGLAAADKTDAWETAGPGSYRLVQRYR